MGQLGDGTTKDHTRPLLIKTIQERVISIAAGYCHSLALLENGEVYAWGRNDDGQLGNGENQDSKYPTPVNAISEKVVRIAAGYQQSLALLENGKVYGWGWNGRGQLGASKLPRIFLPKYISTIDKRILFAPFGKGGFVPGFAELEKMFRELLGQELCL